MSPAESLEFLNIVTKNDDVYCVGVWDGICAVSTSDYCTRSISSVQDLRDFMEAEEHRRKIEPRIFLASTLVRAEEFVRDTDQLKLALEILEAVDV